MTEKKPSNKQSLFDEKTDFLSIPTNQLLDAYGKGSHIPGAGSAAALSGLIAIELLKTVIKLSLKKDEYVKHKTQFEFILNNIETESIRLRELFQKDIDVFNKVSKYRVLRDESEKGTKEYENALKKALDNLKVATDIPIEICDSSLKIISYAFNIFDLGFKSARGDSGVAISNLLSSAQGALFVTFLNLKTFKKSKWKTEKINEAVTLAEKFSKIQKDAFTRVVDLYNENPESEQLKLNI